MGEKADSKKDSALGSHSADLAHFLKKHRLAASGIPCFEATANSKSSSAQNVLKTTKAPLHSCVALVHTCKILDP
ncbi:hypothetical protein [Helicobacter bilis]|uniref:hypothetical protein n=1 Tax=Helicobacter bilis TaxID=37372 RepID=UPI000CF15941|nr:hypothetical protein [Helicobacter bilis]